MEEALAYARDRFTHFVQEVEDLLRTREGGSLPIVTVLKEQLGLDPVLMGFGLETDAVHAPNEHFGLDRLQQGTEAVIRFLAGYGHPAAQP